PVPGQARTIDPTAITPWGLDRAALEGCVGGAFYPGIEAGWQIRHEDLFAAPFRIKHRARSTYLTDDDVVRARPLSRQIAVPWQADFMDCQAESDDEPGETWGIWGWWPSQRPDDVRVSTHDVMVPWVRDIPEDGEARHEWMKNNWKKLGFVLRVGTTEDFVEVDR